MAKIALAVAKLVFRVLFHVPMARLDRGFTLAVKYLPVLKTSSDPSPSFTAYLVHLLSLDLVASQLAHQLQSLLVS